MENQLVKRFHRHVARIVVITDDFAENLCPHTLEFCFVERRVLEYVG